jgi:hypothetical protein
VGKPRLGWPEDAENDLREMNTKKWRKKANTLIEKNGHLS